jgi:hypothetical protein
MKLPFKNLNKDPKPTFTDSLNQILNLCKENEKIKVGQIFKILSLKGYAAILIFFSLPFCTPLQIPGFSTPFGIILAFIGLRLAFAKKLWWPKWILERSFPSSTIEKLVNKIMHVVQWIQKFIKPRLTIFTSGVFFRRINGLLVFLLAIFLSLPLPIPFTNLLSAVPILCIGLGILEDDGVFILLGYFFALVCFSAFIGLFIWGKSLFI